MAERPHAGGDSRGPARPDAARLGPGVGDGVLIDSLGHGWFFNILWADGRESFLVNPQPETDGPVGIDPGDFVELPSTAFSPFERVWQAVAYWLAHAECDPSLVWTEESPFPDL